MKLHFFSDTEDYQAKYWLDGFAPKSKRASTAWPPRYAKAYDRTKRAKTLAPAMGLLVALSSTGGLGLASHIPFVLGSLWPWSTIQDEIPASDPMPAGAAAASMPGGYIAFCLSNKEQCDEPLSREKVIHLDIPVWQTIQKINADVNDAIRMLADKKHYGRAEVWTIPTDGRGDCEDYALTKQKKLMEMGFSVRALRLAVVDTPQREGHVVLTVVTDRGDYVLDNRSPWVLPWRKADYIWFKRQDPDHALAWVQLDPRPGPILTSAAGLSCPDLSLHG
jgi:predicted transglutaminase-like cysteine proteinase